MSVTSAVNSLNESVQQFSGNISTHVEHIDSATSQIRATADDVRSKIEKFREDIMSGEEKQLAHESIIRIDQTIKEQFGNYDQIRKTIIGVVRDFDINLVRNSTIEELSEELWITSSRYWLSYALLAVTAWVNNYPDVAKNAISESCRRDQIKSALFFCLLNLRFERIETAREWFKFYCRTLNPTMLQQETAVMIQAFMGGVFGKDKQLEHEVVEILNDWIRIISEDAVICESLVKEYQTYLENFHVQVQFPYAKIREFCSNSDEVQRSYTEASKFCGILELVEELNVDGVMQTEGNYKSRVDAVLMSLITNYDEEEQELKAQQQYYHLIVSNNGNKEVAQQQFDQLESLRKESYNIGRQMIGWVINENGQNDVTVRKFGLQSTKRWFEAGLENWSVAVNGRLPRQFTLKIDEWSGTSNGSDLEDQRSSLTNYFENNKFRIICLNTFNYALAIVFFVALIITVAGIVSTAKKGFNPAMLVGLVLMAGSAAFLAFRVMNGKKTFQTRVNTALDNLSGTFAEITEFKRFFEENTAKKNEILSKLNFI